jgi:uncharacterized integral membrane protein
MDSLSSSDPPSSGPYPGEEGSRLSGAWTALVVGVVTLLVILVFILQNLQSVGAIIVLAFGGGRILQLRLVARRARRQSAGSSPPVR